MGRTRGRRGRLPGVTMAAQDTETPSELVLVFTVGGQAVLEEDEEIVWSSDNDEDFLEEVGAGFLTEEDALRILTYLQESDVVTEAEAPDIAIEVESYDASDLPDLEHDH